MTSDQELSAKLLELCRRWIAENKVQCAEAIYQIDNITFESLEFVEKICELVGYDKFDG